MRFRCLIFSRLFLGLNLMWNGKYRNSVAEDRAALALHLGLLAVAAIGPNSQILHAFDPVGDVRRTDTDAHMIRPEFFPALGVEGHDVAGHFARKDQVTGGRQHTAE